MHTNRNGCHQVNDVTNYTILQFLLIASVSTYPLSFLTSTMRSLHSGRCLALYCKPLLSVVAMFCADLPNLRRPSGFAFFFIIFIMSLSASSDFTSQKSPPSHTSTSVAHMLHISLDLLGKHLLINPQATCTAEYFQLCFRRDWRQFISQSLTVEQSSDTKMLLGLMSAYTTFREWS